MAKKPVKKKRTSPVAKEQPGSSSVHVDSPPQGKKVKTSDDAEQSLALNNDDIDILLDGDEEGDDQEVEKGADGDDILHLAEAALRSEEGEDTLGSLPPPAARTPDITTYPLRTGGGLSKEPSGAGAPVGRSEEDLGADNPGPEDDDEAGVDNDLNFALGETEEKTSDKVDSFVHKIKKVAGQTQRAPIFKLAPDKQIVYGVILAPWETDLQADILYAEDIEKTAHDYLVKSRCIKIMHEGSPVDADVVESYIAPVSFTSPDMGFGAQEVKKGSWVMAVKINDAAVWRKVKSGEYQAFSVGGLGLREKLV